MAVPERGQGPLITGQGSAQKKIRVVADRIGLRSPL
jgi:hypothetical protein